MAKYGRVVRITLSDEEYSRLVELCLERKASVTGLVRKLLLPHLNRTTDLRPENVTENKDVWPLYISTPLSEMD
jgi:hypothetical protein